MRWCAVQLARRPLLGLTLAIVLVLLVSSISEIMASWQINATIQQTAATNASLRREIDQTNQMIATHRLSDDDHERSAPVGVDNAAEQRHPLIALAGAPT